LLKNHTQANTTFSP